MTLGFLLKKFMVFNHICLLKPKLNIAMPSPPFEIIIIDCLTISGIFTPHLQKKKIALFEIKNFVNNLPQVESIMRLP